MKNLVNNKWGLQSPVYVRDWTHVEQNGSPLSVALESRGEYSIEITDEDVFNKNCSEYNDSTFWVNQILVAIYSKYLSEKITVEKTNLYSLGPSLNRNPEMLEYINNELPKYKNNAGFVVNEFKVSHFSLTNESKERVTEFEKKYILKENDNQQETQQIVSQNESSTVKKDNNVGLIISGVLAVVIVVIIGCLIFKR